MILDAVVECSIQSLSDDCVSTGAVLRALYKAERGQISDAVQLRTLSTSGDVPRSARECPCQTSWFRFPNALHSLSAQVLNARPL